MGLEVSFSDDFCISESQIFLPRGFKVLDFFPLGLQESNVLESIGTANQSGLVD